MSGDLLLHSSIYYKFSQLMSNSCLFETVRCLQLVKSNSVERGCRIGVHGKKQKVPYHCKLHGDECYKDLTGV